MLLFVVRVSPEYYDYDNKSDSYKIAILFTHLLACEIVFAKLGEPR